MASKLEEAVITLLRKEPYYGNLILNMNKSYSTKYGVAAVSITDKINLYINPEIYNVLPLEQRVAVLIHEAKHITHDHISRGKRISTKMNKGLNIAADRAINEMLEKVVSGNQVFAEIPNEMTISLKGASADTRKALNVEENQETFTMKPVTVANFKKSFPDVEVLNGQSMEYYYKLAKQNAQKGGGSGNDFDGDMDTLDDHTSWEESEENDEVREQVLKNAIKKAAERSPPGSTPGEVKELLEKWAQSVVNWKSELRRFVQHAVRTKLESSRKKRHRRYGIMYPGFKKKPELTIACPIDTSGSVSTPMIEQFFGEMAAIHKMGIKLIVIECDTQITAEYEFDPKKQFAITGRGGTSFKPVFERVAKMRNVDAIIYFTDGECYEEIEYTKPTLWALTPSYCIPKGGENRHIKITMPNNGN